METFLISCEFSDSNLMQILCEGCKVHSDIECFPLWEETLDLKIENVKERFPHIKHLEETWVAIFPNQEAMETFAELLVSVEFNAPDYIRFVRLDSKPEDTIFKMGQFHKYVFHR